VAILFAEELTKQFFRTFRAFFSHKHRLCFPDGIADKAFLVQAIQCIPIMTFPSPKDNLAKLFFTEGGEPE
jgi:hypothetical protein